MPFSTKGVGHNSPHIYSPSLLTYLFEKGPEIGSEMGIYEGTET